MAARQCPKRVHLEVHHRELARYSPQAEAAFEMGHRVGEKAIDLYGGDEGAYVAYPTGGLAPALAETARLMAARDRKPIFISKRRMGEFDALCHLDVPDMPPRKIRALRTRARVSQAVFAAVLNISISTVQKWEAGDKTPSGPSLRLLSLIEHGGWRR